MSPKPRFILVGPTLAEASNSSIRCQVMLASVLLDAVRCFTGVCLFKRCFLTSMPDSNRVSEPI